MSKRMYLITHGEREYWADPGHTRDGSYQIMNLVLPEDATCFVLGTGTRFQEIRQLLCHTRRILNLPVIVSPFCGSADSLNADGKTVTLANNVVVKLSGYIGLDSGFLDVWRFLGSLPIGAVICAGGELMLALAKECKSPPKPEKASLYELDVEAKTIKKIS